MPLNEQHSARRMAHLETIVLSCMATQGGPLYDVRFANAVKCKAPMPSQPSTSKHLLSTSYQFQHHFVTSSLVQRVSVLLTASRESQDSLTRSQVHQTSTQVSQKLHRTTLQLMVLLTLYTSTVAQRFPILLTIKSSLIAHSA